MLQTGEKKHLSFASLINFLSGLYLKVEDHRETAKVEHSIRDTAMSAVAMMHFQSTSVLHFQRQLEEENQRSNLSTIFGVDKVP